MSFNNVPTMTPSKSWPYFDPEYETMSSLIDPPRVVIDNDSEKGTTLVKEADVVRQEVVKPMAAQGQGAGLPPNAPPPRLVQVVAPAPQIPVGPTQAGMFDIDAGLAVGSPPRHTNENWNIFPKL